MFHAPHPDLNEEERALLGIAPEQSLRGAVERGVLSLDRITERLPPHAAAVVRDMVTGERPPTPDTADTRDPERDTPPSLGAALYAMLAAEREPEPPVREVPPPPTDAAGGPEEPNETHDLTWRVTYDHLSAWPTLQRAVDEETLTLSEAMALAQTIDHALGRYMTGTRYAAP